MENSTEKLWFVYMGDHHEGPFSKDEVQTKLNTGVVTQQHYVWKEGMGDWKVMTDVPELGIGAPPPPEPTGVTMTQEVKASEALPELFVPDSGESAAPVMSEEPALDMPTQAEPTGSFDIPGMEQSHEPVDLPTQATPAEYENPGFAPESGNTPVKLEMPKSKPAASTPFGGAGVFNTNEIQRAQRMAHSQIKQGGKSWDFESGEDVHRKKRRKRLFLILLIGGLGGAYHLGYLNPILTHPKVKASIDLAISYARPFLAPIAEKIPGLGDLLSPIPSLSDVSIEDLATLRQAATQNITAGGRVSIALSNTDLKRPKFYVASNLPDGARFDVLLQGIPDSLLNHSEFTLLKSVNIANKYQLTPNFESEIGVPIPQGQYQIYVFDSQEQPPTVQLLLSPLPVAPRQPPIFGPIGVTPIQRKVIEVKTYFLGGLNDEAYKNRLSEYHQRLKTEVAREVDELLQYVTTLNNGLLQLVEQFNKDIRVSNIGVPPGKLMAFSKSLKEKTTLLGQIKNGVEKVQTGDMKKKLFHSALYAQLSQGIMTLQELYDLQSSWVSKKVDKNTLEVRYPELEGRAKEAFNALVAKANKAKELGLSANGMPQKVE